MNMNRMPGLVVLCLLLSVWGCEKHEPTLAVGPNDEISVFTNTAPDGDVAGELRRVFAYDIQVPGNETAFRLDFIAYRRFGVHRYVKNQILAVDLSGDDSLARDLPGMIAPVAETQLAAREPFLLLVRDYWATGQTTLVAAAWSHQDLLRLLEECDAEAWRRAYENAVVAGLTKTIFSLGEDKSIPAQVARRYGWTMRLTSGFHAAEHPQGEFVKFNAEEPVRLLLIHWEDGEVPLEPDAWSPIIDRVLDVYNDGDFILASRTRVFSETFQDQPAVKWEGVWQNEKYVIGGPFRAFACHRDGKSYLLIGIVFAPGQDKVYALRQVEAILSTFRTVN